MQTGKPTDVTELSREGLLEMVSLLLGDVLVHYGMWFTETVKHMGVRTALEREKEVLKQYYPLAANRLAPHFGIEMTDGLPTALASKSREELLLLIADIAKTWLTGDGLWFQALEAKFDMNRAKVVNDVCWSHFAHMEAFKIKQFLELGDSGGLHALEQALSLRIYSTINAYSTSWDLDGSLLFKMTECRVQSARRRKDMEDYPCKSAGIIEHTEFATEIDSRISTECVWCPPDRVPDQEFCTWRFRMN
ncbi:MAG TPA: DUF6125 family protein [Desulfomonilaceae bacterium]|nr:DUF6125 family protein [Desulfomonilaceae bacterium]